MNKAIKEQIIKNIKDIEKTVQKMDSGKYIPHIEIDIALSKTRELYESLQWFNQEEEIETAEPLYEQAVPETPIMAEDEDKIDFVDENMEEEVIDESVEMIVRDERKEPDLFGHSDEEEKVSINEKILSDNPKTDLQEKIHKTHLNDLRDGIGINDRFTYIRELFGGDVNRFNETVMLLNNTESLKSAYDYMKKNLDSDVDSQAYTDFRGLVERKFSIK